MASQAAGASGTRISSRLGGRCVNTIVFSPKRSAIHPAARSDRPESTPPTQKKTRQSAAGERPQRTWNQ